MLHYTLSDFHDISKKGFEIVLPQNTVNLINSLSEHVSSPTYIRTPVFVKKDTTNEQDKKRKKDKNNNRRIDGTWNIDKYKNSIISKTKDFTGDTKSNIVFKSPLLEKKDMTLVEIYIQKVRTLLNKVASNSDIDLITQITNIFDEMLETDITAEDVEQISNKITYIMTTNSFYSDDYSRIYSIIYKKYSFIQDTFNNNIDNNYLLSYDEIKDVNPDEDYDTFCSINKKNDERRSKTLFYTKMYNYKIVSIERLIDIIYIITNRLYNNLNHQDKIRENDEIIENICMLINNKNTDMFERCSDINITIDKEDEPSISIQKFIVDLQSSKPKQYNGISTKSLFKLIETIETNQKR